MPCPPCGVLYMYVPSVQRNNGYAVSYARKSISRKVRVLNRRTKTILISSTAACCFSEIGCKTTAKIEK